ncbi:MAG: hypothetical protein EA396_05755 [Anaerolineaceae bacterium]|nr:MAG: hypothetical protein EA396_05755 [Anaerolineaceae bacterium]
MMTTTNWTRDGNGGITAFDIQRHSDLSARVAHRKIVNHMRRIYQHEQIAFDLYQQLAERTAKPASKQLYGRLQLAEAEQLKRRAKLLKRLGAKPPRQIGTALGRLWRAALVKINPRYALMWLRWIKRGDVRRQREAANLLREFARRS